MASCPTCGAKTLSCPACGAAVQRCPACGAAWPVAPKLPRVFTPGELTLLTPLVEPATFLRYPPGVSYDPEPGYGRWAYQLQLGCIYALDSCWDAMLNAMLAQGLLRISKPSEPYPYDPSRSGPDYIDITDKGREACPGKG